MDNKVELLGYYGSDETHAQSAWTSTNRELTETKMDRIPSLLNMLATEGHHTPFEKSTLHFLVTSDIATHIHFLKHRIGVSINGESARYKELKEDKTYLPEDWEYLYVNRNDIFENNKDLHWYLHLTDQKNSDWKQVLESYINLGDLLYHQALKDIAPELGRKRAKESARFFKTYASQITYDVSFNFRSFYHFLSLRNKPEAQKEVRELAQQMLDLVKNIEGNPFEHTLKAFKIDE